MSVRRISRATEPATVPCLPAAVRATAAVRMADVSGPLLAAELQDLRDQCAQWKRRALALQRRRRQLRSTVASCQRALEGDIECPVCLVPFGDVPHQYPVALIPCGHTVCSSCAQGAVQRTCCSICSQPLSVDGLPSIRLFGVAQLMTSCADHLRRLGRALGLRSPLLTAQNGIGRR